MLSSIACACPRSTLLAAAWYWTYGIHAIVMQQYSQQYARDEGSTFVLFVWITAVQLLLGSLLGSILMKCVFRSGGDSYQIASSTSTTPRQNIGLPTTLFYASASLMMNLGFRFGSAFVVQSIQLIEPLQTLLVAKCIWQPSSERNGTNAGMLGSWVLTIGAVLLLISDEQTPTMQVSISLTIISGFLFAACNLLQHKERHEKETRDYNPSADAYILLRHFTHLSWYGFMILSLPCVASLPCWLPNMDDFIKAMNGQVFYWQPMYHLVSLLTLSSTSGHLYSLLKAGSRITAILMAFLWLQEPISGHRITGLVLAGFGALWYAAETKTSSFLSRGMTISLVITSVAVVHLLFVIVPAMRNFQIGNLSDVSLSDLSYQKLTSTTSANLSLFPTTIPAGRLNAGLGEELRNEMRKMTELALVENKVNCTDCDFLIPNKLVKKILLGETRQARPSSQIPPPYRYRFGTKSSQIGNATATDASCEDRLLHFAAKYRDENVIHLNRNDSRADHFFQLVACFLTRTIPVLSATWNADLVTFTSSFGFAFYLTKQFAGHGHPGAERIP